MQSKNALSNLKNRYLAVLKKCHLLNAFGSLALASFLALPMQANAAIVNPFETSVDILKASTSEIELENYGTITGALNDGRFIGMFAAKSLPRADYIFTNYASGIIQFTASERVYGMHIENYGNFKLVNEGLIDITSTNGRAYAMSVEGEGDHELTNSGNLFATTQGYYSAFAMSVEGEGDHNLANNGNITVNTQDGYAYAMSVDGDGDHKLTNSKNITINTQGGDAEAYAMYVEGEGDHTLINSGDISVNIQDGLTYVMYVNGSGDHKFTNNGNITIDTQDADATAMYVGSIGDHELTNNGNITIDTHGDDAYAMYVDSDGDHTLINNKDITINSHKGNTKGMYASSSDANTKFKLINNGNINITALENANGMHTHLYNSNETEFTNKGNLTVTSQNAEANGMYMSNPSDDIINTTITNSGKITVTGHEDANGINIDAEGEQNFINSGIITASSQTKNAYGVYFSYAGNATINNTGIILATNIDKGLGNVAYEIFATITALTVEKYATSLREWTASDAVFYVSSRSSISFDNTSLILRPGTIEQGFAFGKQYDVAHMISDGRDNSSIIDGTISNVQTEVKFLTAHLDNSIADAPKVSITANVNPETVTPLQAQKLEIGNFQNKVIKLANKKINRMLKKRMAKNLKQISENAYKQGVILASNANYTAPSYAHPWQIYLDAYASYTGNNEYNYGTNTKGMTIGGEKSLSDKLAIGFAMDFSDSTTDGQDGFVSDSTDITLAVNADYYINPDWYVSGNMALSFADSDMTYALSPSLYADDDYSSSAFYMAINTGYIYELNENNIIIPEFGLSYLHASSDSINIDFAASDLYDMRITNDDFSALYAQLSLTWQGQYDYALGTLTPSAGIGIRQNITGSDIDSSLTFAGSSFDSVAHEDDTTFLFNTGLEWNKENFTLGLYYDGAYGSDQKSHTANVKFKLEF